MRCPECGEPCDRDEVDVGVGVIHGPWWCPDCGWATPDDYTVVWELTDDGLVVMDRLQGLQEPRGEAGEETT